MRVLSYFSSQLNILNTMTNLTDLPQQTRLKLNRKFVYLIHMINTNYYKIGISDDSDARVIALQNFSPFELKLIYSKEFEESEMVESYIHNFYIKHRLRGEWFEFLASDVFDVLHFLGTLEYSNDLKNEVKNKLRLQKNHKQNIRNATQRGLVTHSLRLMAKYPIPQIMTNKQTGDLTIWFNWKIPGTKEYKQFRYRYGLNYEKNLEVRMQRAEGFKNRIIKLFEAGVNPLENPDEFKRLSTGKYDVAPSLINSNKTTDKIGINYNNSNIQLFNNQ